jgi:hypothetical protein
MAINQNIFGYEAVDPIDWSKSANELSKTIFTIGERRETEKKDLDKLKMDTLKVVQQSEGYNSQTFGQKFTTAAQKGREYIKLQNDMLKRGEITPDEYKLNMNNFTESWGMLGNSIKGFDAKYAELQKQISDGKASLLTVEAGQYFAQMGDLKNLDMFIGEGGTWMTGRLDAKTGQIIPDTIESSKSIADANNAVFDKVNLIQEIEDISSTFGSVIKENGILTTKDARQNPAFQSKLIDIQNAMTTNNRLTASILADNVGGGYTTYFTEGERVNKLESMIQKENEVRSRLGLSNLSGDDLDSYLKEMESKLIPMKKDGSGVYQPMLTDDQVNRAKKAIEDTLLAQLDFSQTQDEIPVGAPKTGSASEDLKFISLAKSAKKNWTSAEALSAMSKNYDFKWNGNNLEIYQLKTSDGRSELVKVGSIKTIDQLGPYIGVPESQNQYWVNSLGAAPSAAPAKPATPKPKPKAKGDSGVTWG